MANPIAASAAATTRTNKANIWPYKSSRTLEKPTKFIFAANSISSMDIKMEMIFFLFMKIPKNPIEKIIEERTK